MNNNNNKQVTIVTNEAETLSNKALLEKVRSRSLLSIWIKTLRQMLKMALYASMGRWAFGLVKTIMKFGGSPAKFLKLLEGEVFSMNPIKWGTLVSLIASYRGVQQSLERTLAATGALPFKSCFGISSMIAGGVSSTGFLAMNNSTRTELSLYMFVRACHGFLTGVVQPRLPDLLRNFQHWDSFSVGLATVQIFYSLFFQPNSISLKYNGFLRACTMQDTRSFEALAAVYRGIVCPEMVSYCKSHNYPMPPVNGTPYPMTELCKYFHPPGTSCFSNPVNFVRRHFFGFSMKLYVPLKLSTTLIFGWKKCIKEPLKQIRKVVESSIKSSLFLTSYCGGPWCLICLYTYLNIRSPVAICIAGGTLSGLSCLFEPKGRRADLGMYCMMHAIRGFYNLLSLRGYLNPATMKQMTLLSFGAMACMFYQCETQPEALHPNVVSTLRAITGESQSSSKKKTPTTTTGSAKDNMIVSSSSSVEKVPAGAVVADRADF